MRSGRSETFLGKNIRCLDKEEKQEKRRLLSDVGASNGNGSLKPQSAVSRGWPRVSSLTVVCQRIGLRCGTDWATRQGWSICFAFFSCWTRNGRNWANRLDSFLAPGRRWWARAPEQGVCLTPAANTARIHAPAVCWSRYSSLRPFAQ